MVGSYISKEYYNGNALGKTIGLSGYNYTIVGILSESAESRKSSADDVIIIPYTNAQQLNSALSSDTAGAGAGGISFSMDNYMFSGTSKDTATASRGIIETILDKVYGEDGNYMVVTSAEMLDMMNTMMDTMMVVLVAIAGISLLVGGIGIMNIMLVSVSKRTRGNRHPQIPGSQAPGHPRTVHHRGWHHLCHRRPDRHRAWHRTG